MTALPRRIKRQAAAIIRITVGAFICLPFEALIPSRKETTMKSDVLHCLNAARAQENLSPLSLDARLMQAAENHAAFMARTEKLSHIGVDTSRFDARIRAA